MIDMSRRVVARGLLMVKQIGVDPSMGQEGSIFSVRMGFDESSRSLRPALIVADKVPDLVTICTVVTKTYGSPLDVPCGMTGEWGKILFSTLGGALWVRTDYIQTIKREWMASYIGEAPPETMKAVRNALRMILGVDRDGVEP